MQRAANAYFQTQVTTTSQGDLLIMLYDAAIKFLNQAKDYLAANDMAKKGNAISKALDVLNELDSTLNIEKGGNLALNLRGLYAFCSTHLVRANLKKDPKMIDEVIKIISGLRSAYAEILVLPEAQAAAQEAAAGMRATAILPPRAQAGATPGAVNKHAPGANARLRSLYAKNDGQVPAEQADAQAGAAPAAASAAPAAASAAPAAAQPAKAPAPKEPDAQADPGLSPYAAPAGLVNKHMGAGLYRKFSGQ